MSPVLCVGERVCATATSILLTGDGAGKLLPDPHGRACRIASWSPQKGRSPVRFTLITWQGNHLPMK